MSVEHPALTTPIAISYSVKPAIPLLIGHAVPITVVVSSPIVFEYRVPVPCEEVLSGMLGRYHVSPWQSALANKPLLDIAL